MSIETEITARRNRSGVVVAEFDGTLYFADGRTLALGGKEAAWTEVDEEAPAAAVAFAVAAATAASEKAARAVIERNNLAREEAATNLRVYGMISSAFSALR